MRGRKAQLMDIVIPGAQNMDETYETKKNNYAERTIQIKMMWGVEKVEVIPVGSVVQD